MQTIFYVPASGSISSSLTVVPENSSIIKSVQTYNGSTLEITASAYQTSGSTFDSTLGELRIYIKTGSAIQASYPADSTVIYYKAYINPSTTSNPTQQTQTPVFAPTAPSLFNANIDFSPNTLIPSPSNSFAIDNYLLTGDKFATGSTTLVAAFTAGTEARIVSGSTVYRFIAMGNPIPDNDVDGNLYFFSTGSSAQSTANNLTASINSALYSQPVPATSATGSTTLAAAFTAGTEARITYGNTVYRFIGTGNPIPSNDIDGNVYFFSTGSSATSTANNLTGSINKALSGSLASASIDLVIANSVGGGGAFQLTGSISGSIYNGITFSTGSGTSFSTQITLGGGTNFTTLVPSASINLVKANSAGGGGAFQLSSSAAGTACNGIIFLTGSNNSFSTQSVLSGGTTTYVPTGNSILSINSSSQSPSVTLLANTNYLLTLSGSGTLYTSSIEIINTSNTATSSYYTASNSYLATVFSSSITSNYIIKANIDFTPAIIITFSSSADIPVLPTNSLAGWNTYLNISASAISSSGNTVYLLSGDVNTNTGSLSIVNNSLTDINLLGRVFAFTSSILSNNKLTTFPNTDNQPNLTYIDLSSNNITGSIPNLSGSTSLYTFICSNNKISGSTPDLPYGLSYFDCSYNKMSGSIYNLDDGYNLSYFSCNYNHLTGSIPSLNNCGNLQNFDCSFNKLSGSIPNLDNQYNLNTFNCSNNYLTGSIPSFISCSALTYFNCSDNLISNYNTGSISSTISIFAASNNLLSQSAVDNILYDLDASAAINGYVDLSGTGNSAPSTTGLSYKNSLVSKGWNVYLNGSLSLNTIDIGTTGYAGSITSNSNWFRGQTFSIEENGSLSYIKVSLYKTGSPSISLGLKIYSVVGGQPNTLIATSTNLKAAASLGESPYGDNRYQFNFSNESLTANTTYAFIIYYADISVINSSNYFEVGLDPTNPYSGGTYIQSNTGIGGTYTSYSGYDVYSEIGYLI